MLAALLLIAEAARLPATLMFDLRSLDRASACTAGTPGDIVVCAPRDRADRNRLGELPSGDYEREAKAETMLGDGVKGAVEVESATLAGGQKSNRVMVRLKFPF